MGMTMTQKILAAHAGRASVSAGDLIEAKLDLVLGNDITTPVAIATFERAGFTEVFDRERIADCAGSLHALQGYQVGGAVRSGEEICKAVWNYSFLRCGRCRDRACAAAGTGPDGAGRTDHRRGLPHVHLRRAGSVLHRRRFDGHGGRYGGRGELV